MPTQKQTQAVPRALGVVTAVQAKIVTVQFADIPANPTQVRGVTRKFQLDVEAGTTYRTGDWVVARWSRVPPVDKTTNAYRVQGERGSVHLRPLQRAFSEKETQSWLKTASAQLKAKVERKEKKGQEKPAEPDPTPVLQTGENFPVERVQNLPGNAWLPVPVGLPQMDEEWGYPDGYVRIGYIAFTVDSPTEEIRVSEVMPFQPVQTLRSRSPIQKGNWHANRQVQMTLTLKGTEAINRVFLPLFRLFRRMPLLPVFNKHLMEHNITGLTLQSIQVATLPGYPNALRAEITCSAFNWEAYLSGAEELDGFDKLVCFPLLKLWAERPRGQSLDYEPMAERWNGHFRLLHPDEDWLQARSELPSAAAAAQAQNDDIDAANTIVRLRTANRPGQLQGFDKDPSQGLFEVNDRVFLRQAIGRARLGAIDTPFNSFQLSLNPADLFTNLAGRLGSQVGVDLINSHVRGTNYAFLRIRSREIADQLARSPDTRAIVRGKVRLRRLTGQRAPGPLVTGLGPEIGEATWAPDGWDRVGKGDFVRQLAQQDQPTLEALRQGVYCFVVAEESPILERIARMNRAAEEADTEDPVGDQETALQPFSMVIEQITAQTENIVAPHVVRGERIPTHQYLGSQSVYFQISGVLRNATEASIFTDFLERVNELGRKYPGRLDGTPFGGFCLVENELFHLLGVRHVLPVSFTTTTIPQYPNAVRFELTLVEFDATQRNRETFADLYEDIEDNPVARIAPGVGQEVPLRVQSIQDPLEHRWIRSADLNRRLKMIELYPDMALPTREQLARWVDDIKIDEVWDWENGRPFPAYFFLNPDVGGTGWQWSQSERRDFKGRVVAMAIPENFMRLDPPATKPNGYIDPDFWCAPSHRYGKDLVDGILKASKGQKFVWQDSYGTKAEMFPGQRLTDDKIVLDPQKTLPKAKHAASVIAVKPVGASPSIVDKVESGQIQIPEAPSSVNTAPNPNAFTIPQDPGPLTGPLRPGSVPANDSGTMEDRIKRYGPAAAAAARRYNLPPDLFFAVIEQESHWRAGAGSNKGALGLGQLTAATARQLGVQDRLDPVDNLNGAARYLRQMLNRFKDQRLALAAYNAGPGNVRKYRGIPPFRETRNYVVQVLQKKGHYRAPGSAPLQAGAPVAVQTSATNRVAPELKNAVEQLKKQFNSGYGYRSSSIFKYLLFKGGRPNKDRFLPEEWFRTDPPATITNLNPGQERFYIPKGEHIPAFLDELRKRNIHLPLEKVPERQPGKFAYEEGVSPLPDHPLSMEQAFHNENGNDMFHDMRRELISGRLLGAFPTYYVAIVHGGRSLRVWKLYDHVYGMMSVTRLAVHRTRKGPVETCVVGFANMYGHLTAQANAQALQKADDTRGVWTLEAIRRGLSSYIRFDEETIAMWTRHLDSLFLKPGARLHVRIGYGADASDLPIVFNGVITSVPISEGEIEVTALSDGVELLNDLAPTNLQGSVPVTRLNAAFGEGWNPRELIMSYMAPTRAIDNLTHAVGQGLQNAGAALAPLSYFHYRNQYGIEHFGSPIRAGLRFDDGEIGVNIYNAESSAPYNQSSAWDNTLRIFQFWRWDKNRGLIGINMANATPWDIFETTRKTIPDYILYPAPFELRSTLFMGKGWFPFYYEYKPDLDREVDLPKVGRDLDKNQFFNAKPFQQIHLASSDWNLLHTMVRADAENVVTKVQAVGTYNGWKPGEGDLSNEASYVMMLDEDIYDEFQKLKVVESGLYTTVAMKNADANSDEGGALRVGIGGAAVGAAIGSLILPGLGTAIGGAAGALFVGGTAAIFEGVFRSYMQSRRVGDFFAAMTLKDHVKEMYQGPLVLLGNPYIKPYDIMAVSDHLSGLNGLCEVREVVHTMSVETGFVTEVTPDCIANFIDYEGRDILLWLLMTSNHILTGVAFNKLVGILRRRMSVAATLRAARHMEKFLADALRKAGGGEVLGIANADFRAALVKLQDDLRELTRLAKLRDGTAIRNKLTELLSKPDYKNIVDKVPFNLKLEIQAQRVLRGIPGTAGFQRTVKAAKLVARQLGRTVAAIPKVGPAAALAGKNSVNLLRKVVGQGLSRTTIGVATAGVGNMLAGSLSDYIVRWAVARQCLTILPLRINDKTLEAGIDGHRGAVYGDNLGLVDNVLEAIGTAVQQFWPLGLLPVIGDLASAEIDYSAGDVPLFLEP